MALTRWNPFDEGLYLRNEMDPVYEDNLARALNKWPELPKEKYVFTKDDREQHPRERVFISMALAEV